MIVWQEHGAKFEPEPVSNIGRIRGFASKKATLSKCLVDAVCINGAKSPGVITLEFHKPAVCVCHLLLLPW